MKIKRNKKSYKWFLCGLILVVVLTISYRVSKANYRISNSIELTTGKVISSPYDFNIVSMYIDGVEQEKGTQIPNEGYKVDKTSSYCCKTTPCDVDHEINIDINAKLFTDSLGNHVFKGISKGSKCKIYFIKDTDTKTMEELLNNYYTDKRERKSENKDFNVPYEEMTTKTVFSAPDDDGTSYYFAGNPTDNWVKFGGYYWRIIRINGDGSVRLIYSGDEESGPQTTGEKTQIGTSFFNVPDDSIAYEGYMYGNPESSIYEELYANINDSTLKQALDNWFINSNIRQGTENFNKIDLNVGFCNDKQLSTSYAEVNGLIGMRPNTTYFGAYIRLRASVAKEPTFECAYNNDLYTHKSSNKGNKTLNYPVGLISADEVVYAGLTTRDYYDKPSNNYLNTNKNYWTISPIWFYEGLTATAFYVAEPGGLGNQNNGVTEKYGIRPVINLRSDVTFTGNGTQSNPYKVVG